MRGELNLARGGLVMWISSDFFGILTLSTAFEPHSENKTSRVAKPLRRRAVLIVRDI
jgi:hypothetical protein